VMPTAGGIRELKKVYYSLTHDPENKHFCVSWNYEAVPLKSLVVADGAEPDYEALFRHFVNSYSVRTTYLGNPSSRCRRHATTKEYGFGSSALNENLALRRAGGVVNGGTPVSRLCWHRLARPDDISAQASG
jgi:hypothetical protein